MGLLSSLKQLKRCPKTLPFVSLNNYPFSRRYSAQKSESIPRLKPVNSLSLMIRCGATILLLISVFFPEFRNTTYKASRSSQKKGSGRGLSRKKYQESLEVKDLDRREMIQWKMIALPIFFLMKTFGDFFNNDFSY